MTHGDESAGRVSDFTDEEERNIRTALRRLQVRVGWEPLAKAMRYEKDSLGKAVSGRTNVTPTLALRIARFAKVSIDDVLSGRWPGEGTCPFCGHRPEDAEDAHNGRPAPKIARDITHT